MPALRFRTAARLACAALLVVHARPAGAQTPGPPQPSASQASPAPIAQLLRDPEALAQWIVTHSRDTAAAAARVDQARATLGASRLRLNPQVSGTLGGLPVGATNPQGLGWGETINYGASLSEQVEIGKRGPRSQAARLRLDAEQLGLSSTWLGSIGEARDAIARVLYMKSRRAALASARDDARQAITLQRVRLERGDLSGIDFDRLELDEQMLESDIAQVEADLQESLAACAAVLFAPCEAGDADLAILGDLLQLPAGLPQGWETQLAARPDIQALQAQQQAAAQDAVLALRRRIPDPIVSAGFTRDRFIISGNNPRTLALDVTLPLALFDRGQYDAARAEAAQRELRQIEGAVTARARSAVQALRDRQATLAAGLAAMKDTALARANTILSSTADAVSQGELSTTDLLLARRARTDATLKVMDLQFQLFLVQNALRQVLGLDAPLTQRTQGVTWPAP